MKDIKTFINSDTPVSVTMTAEDLKEFAQQVAELTIANLNKSNEPVPTWLNPDQVCKRIGINRVTLWRWDKEGYLRGVKFGKRIRYKESDVLRVEEAEKGGKDED